MKRIVLLVTLIAAFALCAGAQTFIDFHDMPYAYMPKAMPDNYPAHMGLYWDSFDYVTPGVWTGEGPGFWVSPSSKPSDVVFTGGVLCNLTVPCTGMIKMNPAYAAPMNKTFVPVSITLSAGWQDNKVTITAYNNGTYVGTLELKVTTTPQTFTFPATWTVTQLAFTPEYLGNNATIPAGSVVIYNFTVMLND